MPTQLVDALERLESGGHICSLYSNEEEQFAAAIPFIRIGLQRGERCMYVAEDECDLPTVQTALGAIGFDVPALLKSGSLVLSTKAESYFKGGHFSPERMLDFWKAELQRARKDGYTGFRGTGVADCATLSSRGFAEWMKYESLATNTFAETGCLCLCQYDRRISSPELALDVIRTHPIVISGKIACQNFYYIPPEDFLAPRPKEREVERLLHTLREHERTGERFRRSQRMEAMGQLAGGIAHDFKNLMTIVTGYSHLLQETLKDSPGLVEQIREIERAGEQATALTRQLLTFSGRNIVQPRLLDLKAVLADAERMLGRVLKENVRLVVIFETSEGLVRADRGQVDQVIVNLVLNARDAMENGGTIEVKLSSCTLSPAHAEQMSRGKAGDFVCLTVADTGHGMTPDIMERIFEPFFTTRFNGGGTGLGLATVDSIVQQSGGFITVESQLGAGSRFCVYLPQVKGALEKKELTRESLVSGGTETILLVEDQNGVRSLEAEILGRQGYRLLTAGDGEEALALLDKYAGDVQLVITDLVMPRMGGVELGERLRLARPKTKVLYTSGYSEDIAALSSPERDFLEKPFTPGSLLRKVEEMLQDFRTSPSERRRELTD